MKKGRGEWDDFLNKIKERIPVTLYRSLLKLFGRKIERKFGSRYLVKETKEFYRCAKEDRRKKRHIVIDGNVDIQISLRQKTEIRAREIKQMLLENSYSFENAKVIKDPYGFTPLSAIVLFSTDEKVSVEVTVKGIGKGRDYTYLVKRKEKLHHVPILYLYPEHSNQVILRLLDEQGKQAASRELAIRTEPLPELMQDAVRIQKHEQESALPFILVAGKSVPFPYAFDEMGNIRYLLTYRPRGYGLFPLANGRFLVMDRSVLIPTYQIPHSTQIYEMDYLGRVYREYHVPKGCHHDICEMVPGGNLLFVSNSNQGHMEDVIVELDRKTGDIVKTLDGRQIFGAYYRDRINWIHINSLHYNAKEHSIVLSARNLHAIVKIDWKSNRVQWILSRPDLWEGTTLYKKVLKPSGNPSWHYQAHSAVPLSDNLDGKSNTSHLMVFDNHWARRRKIKGFDEGECSYVNIYTIDEQKHTVSLEKQYAGVKSKITSNGYLCFDKKRVFSMEGYLEPLVDGRGGMIYEYDYDTARMINQYSIRYFFYRAFAFEPDIRGLAQFSLPIQTLPRGILTTAVEIKTKQEFRPLWQILVEQKQVHIYRTDSILYVWAKDHVVEQIFLVGKQRSYIRDLREPVQTQTYFQEMAYAVAVPLHTLAEEVYDIHISIGGICYQTGCQVSIRHESEREKSTMIK